MPELLMHTLNFVVSFAGISALFALIFKYVPEARIKWKDVWEGAIATALLFTIGKSLIGLYLFRYTVDSDGRAEDASTARARGAPSAAFSGIHP
jgi:membrane protein